MIVLIDIGNTRTKYCTVKNQKRSEQSALLNKDINDDFLNKNFLNITTVVVASVGEEEITNVISSWCASENVVYKRVNSEAKKNNVRNAYKEPHLLGIDRWLALVGAADLFPQKNILIVDSGTATTVDVLTNNGQHLGGWILSGINLLVSSILADTVQVKANYKEKESIAFGINTSENVHNAAWGATVGSIYLALNEAKEQGYNIDELIFTGGNGKLLASLIKHNSINIDDLVFYGLQAYI